MAECPVWGSQTGSQFVTMTYGGRRTQQRGGLEGGGGRGGNILAEAIGGPGEAPSSADWTQRALLSRPVLPARL